MNPRSSASAVRLIKTMEIALAPFCGLWLAAATNGSDRGRAFTALADTVATGLRWGAPIRAWPGCDWMISIIVLARARYASSLSCRTTS